MGKLFLQVLNMSIAASWLVLAVVLLRLALKKAPKWARLLLWGVVAVRLICPFTLESAFSLIPSSTTIDTTRYSARPYIQSGIPAIDQPVNDYLGSHYFESVTVPQGNTFHLAGILGAVWLAGMAVMLIYAAVSYWRLRKRNSTAILLRDNIFQGEMVDSPFVLGLFRPKIYLPFRLEGKEIGYVVAHEQAHIRRKDHWWKPLGFLLLAFYWFNPLLWLAYALMCRDIELACDEKVVRELGPEQRADYSQTLLKCSAHRGTIAACPLAFGEVGVKERVKAVLHYKRPAFWLILLAAAAVLILVVCFLTSPLSTYDSLKLISMEQSGGRSQSIQFQADLGHQVGSGTIVAEQWWNGECVKSAPLSFTGLAKEISLSLVLRMGENNQPKGVDIQINTDQYGGSLLTYFSFPEGVSPQGWSLTSYQEEETIEIEPNQSVILAAMAFDLGEGIESFNIKEPTNESELLESKGYRVILRGNFSEEKATSQETGVINTIVPGTTYITDQCVYLNPLSSYMPVDGDSGYRYTALEDAFVIEYSLTGDKETIPVSSWEWQNFPYSDEEWAALYNPDWESIEDIHHRYSEILFQPLTELQFLLRADEELWIVELNENQQMGVYLWSIYSLVPQSSSPFEEKKEPLSMEKLLSLAAKGEELTWQDFENYDFVETGSGLYIRVYEIDEMFSLWIGGTDLDSQPMYFYLMAKDGSNSRIDIRDGGVEEYIQTHQDNPVVTDISANWQCCPVGFSDEAFLQMFQKFGTPEDLAISSVRYLPIVPVRSAEELKAFQEEMVPYWDFDLSYPDTFSFSEVIGRYDASFFNSSTLLLVYIPEETTENRHSVEYIRHSEGTLSVGITTLAPEAGETSNEGWLLCIRVPSQQITGVDRFQAFVSSTQKMDKV